jgi:hypothetical protein
MCNGRFDHARPFFHNTRASLRLVRPLTRGDKSMKPTDVTKRKEPVPQGSTGS